MLRENQVLVQGRCEQIVFYHMVDFDNQYEWMDGTSILHCPVVLTRG
jgi:hypothetical protein